MFPATMIFILIFSIFSVVMLYLDKFSISETFLKEKGANGLGRLWMEDIPFGFVGGFVFHRSYERLFLCTHILICPSSVL